jgi:serine protease AprX
MPADDFAGGSAGAPGNARGSNGANGEPDFRSRIGRSTIPPMLHDPAERERLGMHGDENTLNDFVIELNLLYKDGVEQGTPRFQKLYADTVKGGGPPEWISKTYFRCSMSLVDARALVHADEREARERAGPKGDATRERLIYKLWPDFKVHALIDRSVATVKADAAYRSYAASGAGIVWAVLDSGIDATHPHFGNPANPITHTLLHPMVAGLHRDFTSGAPPIEQQTGGAGSAALKDEFGHGTHVAGIIAGGLRETVPPESIAVYEQVFSADDVVPVTKHRVERSVPNLTALHGVAPDCRIVSLRVLDASGTGRASDIIRALQYIRSDLNGDPKLLRVHGVNLSVGYEFDAEMFACGQSPLCVEVDRLVNNGVVVVVAAGNTGYGRVSAEQRTTKVGLSNTINDPGNAALAITVGATHRDSPHMYGVSYFSSKGPTSDGRIKPDLVAPGERITSCATAAHLTRLGVDPPEPGQCAYIDDSGTSMAAPHVSGAVAAFLSIRREFILQPDVVKRIFLDSATPLGRERYFEGRGLVDLMRAIQSV